MISFYKAPSAFFPPHKNQRLFWQKNCRWEGISHRTARFIEENQLLCREDWELFLRQFSFASDDDDRGWRGEYFGKMMRGACMTYQYTENEELYALLRETAQNMLKLQQENGRFSTYSREKEFNGWDLWCRKYVLLGLIHFHEICREEKLRAEIETALQRHLEAIAQDVGEGRKSIGETSHRWGCINSASLLEPVVLMARRTGRKDFLALAEHIVNFLSQGEESPVALALADERLPFEYPVNKAYEMMSCFEGLLEYADLTGDEKWKTATLRFTQRLKESDVSLIGCAGCYHEQFNHASQRQTDPSYTGIMQETCVTVTWMKLCHRLLLLTGDSQYADEMEKSYYNALLGAVNHRRIPLFGGFLFDSYSPLLLGQRGKAAGGYKPISPTRYYGCCAAIGAAGTALFPLAAVCATAQGWTWNFYESGQVDADGFRFSVSTRYPTEGAVTVSLQKGEGERELSFRIPSFAKNDFRILLNGKEEAYTAENGYARLRRIWKTGDELQLLFSMNPRLLFPEGFPEDPRSLKYVAVQYGPLVLARDSEITSVDSPVSSCEPFLFCKKDSASSLLRAEVTLGEEVLELIDYGSAGKSWDPDLPFEAWIPLR